MAKVEPCSAVTGSVRDALRLGCAAIGFTIYPGSSARNTMYEEIRELILEAKEHGLPTVMWAYPRGAGLAKEGEQAADITAYAAQVACQLGAHIVKVKPPKDIVYQDEAKKVFEKYAIPTKTLADRVRHVVQSCFAGKRIVIFSGGEAKDDAARDGGRQADRRRRRLRLDHGAQRLPAPARRRAQAARRRHERLQERLIPQ